MTGARQCPKCMTQRDPARRVHTKVPGARPVDMALCDCDFLRCRNVKCRATTRGLPRGARHCAKCRTPL